MTTRQIEILLSAGELDLLLLLLQEKHAQAFLSNPSQLPKIDKLLGKLTARKLLG